MKRYTLLTVLTVLMTAGSGVRAGIPLPDVVLFGPIFLNGGRVLASADVTVVARVDGVADPIAAYKMGQSSTAGDAYVLRLRLEAPVPGSPLGAGATTVGKTARIFVKVGDGVEVSAADYAITEMGKLQPLVLQVSVLPGNCFASDSRLDLQDQRQIAGCLTGPEGVAGAGCTCADSDVDGDVDLRDWGRFQSAYTGS